MSADAERGARRRVLWATAAALIVAAILLVVAVLPAEYGIDPLGTGRALGLLELSGVNRQASSPSPSLAAPRPADGTAVVALAEDTYSVELRPFEGVEYKYRLEQGASLVYAWQATGSVEFEFHGEPDGAPAKYFDSYAKGQAASGQGAFTAAKSGIHGWYWKNTGAGRITVTLKTAGFYVSSTEFRDGDRIERVFPRK